MDDITAYLQQINKENYEAQADYEGYSPMELNSMRYDPFGATCPVQINLLSEKDYQEIPIFNQVKYLLNLIEDRGELKLTKKGNLPVQVVVELYQQGFLKDYFIEKGFAKIVGEDHVPSIIFTKALLLVSRLVKKRNNKLSLTRRGSKILQSNELLFQEINQVYTQEYSWAYIDRYADRHIGQMGFIFSLVLLSKYGSDNKTDDFYAEKYLQAFPEFIEDFPHRYSSSAYIYRTFDQFLTYYGFIILEEKRKFEPRLVTATPLFHKMIRVHPHNSQ